MRQNFLVWLFDNRAQGVIEIDNHTKALKNEAAERKKSGKIERTWISVLYTSEENAAKKLLGTAQAEDNVYVLGHTNVGLTSLWSKSSGGEELKGEAVASRLDWIDLPNIPLKLKLFSCYSAVCSLGGSDNLAKEVKKYLPNHGNIEIYGYTDTVVDYQDGTYFNPQPHKWNSTGMLASRASSCRVRV